MRMFKAALLLVLVATPWAGAAWAQAGEGPPPSVAVFPLELLDTSGEPPRADQERRLRMLDGLLRTLLAESGRYAPVEARLPEGSPQIRNCNRCDVAEAERLGAGLALSGVVQKVSNLILSLTLTLREVPSGRVRATWSADFRGNTDESWERALRWLLRNRLLAPPEPAR